MHLSGRRHSRIVGSFIWKHLKNYYIYVHCGLNALETWQKKSCRFNFRFFSMWISILLLCWFSSSSCHSAKTCALQTSRTTSPTGGSLYAIGWLFGWLFLRCKNLAACPKCSPESPPWSLQAYKPLIGSRQMNAVIFLLKGIQLEVYFLQRWADSG